MMMIRIVMIDIALLLPCRALDGEGPYPLAAVTNQARAGGYPLVNVAMPPCRRSLGLTCRFSFHAKAEGSRRRCRFGLVWRAG
jgi:hypothetical protein